MPNVVITTNSYGITVNGQTYPKGSIRPVYNGDYVDLMFPWWNNTPVGGIPIGSVKWSDISGNSGTFGSRAAFQTFFDSNMSSGGPLSAPAVQFKIGDGNAGTPANGSNTYYNPNITLGSKVFQNGFGALTWGTDIAYVTGGGFSLLNGNTFNTDQTYVAFF